MRGPDGLLLLVFFFCSALVAFGRLCSGDVYEVSSPPLCSWLSANLRIIPEKDPGGLLWVTCQGSTKSVSDSLKLVDFPIGQVDFIRHLPDDRSMARLNVD